MANKKTARKNKRRAAGFRRWLPLLGGGALVAIVGAAVYFALAGSDEPPRRPVRVDPVVTTEMQVRVAVVDKDYEPRDLTVPVGATVTWVFEGELPHNVTEDRGAWESGNLRQGDEWTMTFDKPASYYYYCTLHHIMLGSLTVAENPQPTT